MFRGPCCSRLQTTGRARQTPTVGLIGHVGLFYPPPLSCSARNSYTSSTPDNLLCASILGLSGGRGPHHGVLETLCMHTYPLIHKLLDAVGKRPCPILIPRTPIRRRSQCHKPTLPQGFQLLQSGMPGSGPSRVMRITPDVASRI